MKTIETPVGQVKTIKRITTLGLCIVIYESVKLRWSATLDTPVWSHCMGCRVLSVSLSISLWRRHNMDTLSILSHFVFKILIISTTFTHPKQYLTNDIENGRREGNRGTQIFGISLRPFIYDKSVEIGLKIQSSQISISIFFCKAGVFSFTRS